MTIFILFIYLFFHLTCDFICIYLVICFHSVYLSRGIVMSFRVLTVLCHISLIEAIISIKD